MLFLDEPTSGLDSEVALSVMESLVHLARKGRTVGVGRVGFCSACYVFVVGVVRNDS